MGEGVGILGEQGHLRSEYSIVDKLCSNQSSLTCPERVSIQSL